ncbi:hypothetical protein Rhal01_01374 [Rubritalea halochordaticola]|uniref:Tetratricopeptide repeat protein n=1 Tax=Rubritalea halochordaticola TaxID=714537 RepID=A0ABP9V0R4_9BACT
MKRPLKKIKRWLERWIRVLLIVIVVGGFLGFGAWYALTTDEKPVQQDFGDARVSSIAMEEATVAYAKAEDLIKEGQQAEARKTMLRLAPLAEVGKKAEGYAKAHLWLAKDMLAGGLGGYLEVLPVDGRSELKRAAGGRWAYNGPLPQADFIEQARRRLEDAIELEPELGEAASLLAELLVASKQRNEAIELLLDRVSAQNADDLKVGVLLANSIAFAGDELGLQEQAWLELTTLGREVTRGKRSDLNARVRYLMLIYLLDKQELADVALQKFEGDFGTGKEGEARMARVKSLHHYFRAITLLNQTNTVPGDVVDELIKAYAAQPAEEHYVAALELMAERHPDQKARILEVLKNTSTSRIQNMGAEGLSWCLVMAQLFPEKRTEYLTMAHQLKPGNPEVLTALLQEALREGSQVDGPSLAKEAQLVLDSKSQTGARKMRLELALGELAWKEGKSDEALQMLERALVGKVYASEAETQKIHRLLATVYKSHGELALASTHEKMIR